MQSSANSNMAPQSSASAASASVGGADSKSTGSLEMPFSPARRGYMANPYQSTVEEAHNLLSINLASDSPLMQDSQVDDGVHYSLRQRTSEDAPGRAPVFRGTAFIPNHRPVAILNCIHLVSYRLLWDTRMSSGRIMQRYSQYQFLFYSVFRGIGLYQPRDAFGVQDTRCWGPNGVPQKTANADTEHVDIVYKSIESPEFSSQEGKVRMKIHLGGYQIKWKEELQGCSVTFVGDYNLNDSIPTFLWNVLSKETPMTVGRLRDSVDHFGIPPYILDEQDCVVIQIVSHFAQTRITTLKCHASKSGTYAIVLDRNLMYLKGIQWPPQVEGEGAHAVRVDEWENQIQVTVGPEGVGQEFTMSIHPTDAEKEPTSMSDWW